MKPSRILQFVASIVLMSAGFGLLLAGGSALFTGPCFLAGSWVLYTRSELNRPTTRRELWVSAASLLGLVALVVLGKIFVPSVFDGDYLQHPSVIISMWATCVALLLWLWKKEATAASTQPAVEG